MTPTLITSYHSTPDGRKILHRWGSVDLIGVAEWEGDSPLTDLYNFWRYGRTWLPPTDYRKHLERHIVAQASSLIVTMNDPPENSLLARPDMPDVPPPCFKDLPATIFRRELMNACYRCTVDGQHSYALNVQDEGGKRTTFVRLLVPVENRVYGVDRVATVAHEKPLEVLGNV